VARCRVHNAGAILPLEADAAIAAIKKSARATAGSWTMRQILGSPQV